MKLPRPSAHRYESRIGKGIARILDAFTLICLVAGVVAGAWFCFWVFNAFKPTDLSTLPPDQAFQMVLNQPMPSGVSDVRIAGHASVSGIAWMRFRATNAAIHSVLGNSKLEVQDPVDEMQWAMRQQVLKDEEARAVGWDKILRLKKIESRQFHFAPYRGSGWAGEIIVDHANRIVYVSAGLL